MVMSARVTPAPVEATEELAGLVAAFRADPESPEPLAALAGHAGERGLWALLAREVASALEAPARPLSPVRRLALLVGLGRLQFERLGAPDAALASFEAVMEATPRAAPALQVLEAALADPILAPEAADLVAPSYEAHAELRSLAALHDLRARAGIAPGARSPAVHRIALFYEAVLGDQDMAFKVLLRAFEQSPFDDATYLRLTLVALRAGRSRELVSLCRMRALTLDEPRLRAGLLLRVSLIEEIHLLAYDDALASALTALESAAVGEDAIGRCERLATITGRWDALVTALEVACLASEGPALGAALGAALDRARARLAALPARLAVPSPLVVERTAELAVPCEDDSILIETTALDAKAPPPDALAGPLSRVA